MSFIKLPIILSVFIYVCFFLIRFQQGGWDIRLDLFRAQREILDQTIGGYLPSPQAELLSGIILGEKKSLPPEFRLALRDTSTLHIVVVSGQNLTLVSMFFLALSGLIKRRVAICLSFLAIIFYTLLTGAQIPVLRAAIMVSLTFIAQIFGRQKEGLWVLSLTGGLMLLINPNWIFDLSFQLSFMATFGLIVITPVLLKKFKFLPLIGQDLAVTLGAQIMVIPIIAQNFHQISLVGVITNVLIGWTIPFIMIFGGILLVLNFFSQFLTQMISLILATFLTYFVYVVYFFASLPFSWEYIGEQFWIVWIGYYLVVAGALIIIHKKLDVRSEKLDKEV